MAITWYSGPPQEYTTPASAQIDGLLDALNTLIVANSASASATWEVIQYNSSTPRSILLRRKNGSAGRIVIFGNNGSTPNAAAVRGTATASTHYIGYSATSTTNTVSNYTTGAPLPDSDYIPGVACWGIAVSTFYTLAYAEFADGIYFNVATSTGHSVAGAGSIVEDINGTAYPAIQGTGTNGAAGWGPGQSNTGGIFPPSPGTDASYSSSTSAIVVRFSSANSMLYRLFSISGTSSNLYTRLLDASTHRHHFFPVWLCWNTTAAASVFGKLRGIAFGPQATRWAERFTVGSPPNPTSAYALGYGNINGNTNPVWFVNFDI
jgi:hypothetical protein